MMRSLLFPIVFLMILFSGCRTGEPLPVAAPTPEQSTPVNIAIVGDSITNAGFYLRNLEQFYITRFPEAPTHWFNCGLGGETARRYIEILDADLFANDPDKVFIMFGMNDLNLDFYTRETDRNLQNRASAVNSYQNAMRALVQAIKDRGISDITLFVPSPFDHELGSRATFRDHPGYNDALAGTKEFLTQLADEENLTVIDMNTPLVEANALYREQARALHGEDNADVTVISFDRIHPGPIGNWLIAYAFMDQMDLSGEVASVTIDAVTGKLTAVSGAAVTDVVKHRNGVITYRYSPWRLPLYPSDGYYSADNLVPLTNRFNREIITVTGLEPGEYVLQLENGDILGVYSGSELSDGVNISTALRNPNYIQSEKLHSASELKRMRDQVLRRMRRLELYTVLLGLDMNNREDITAAGRVHADLYSEYAANCTRELQDELAGYRQLMLDLNTPVAYQITVRPR
jgi:lysophospholipase L1-like esterase